MTPESVDNFIEDIINVVYNTSHFHTLARFLTPAHSNCLSRFKTTKIQSHLQSNCYLMKRLALAFRHVLDTRTIYCSKWFPFEWTLLMICLAQTHLSST